MTFVVDVRIDGGDRPTGDVVFTDGLETLGVVAVVAPGFARFTTSDLAPGDHEIVAHYSGDASCAPSWGTFAQRVVHGDVTVDVQSSANPAPEQAPVEIAATVAAHGTLHPTGEVTFHLGADRIGVVRPGEGGSATRRLSERHRTLPRVGQTDATPMRAWPPPSSSATVDGRQEP